jgi:hypothetical protein
MNRSTNRRLNIKTKTIYTKYLQHISVWNDNMIHTHTNKTIHNQKYYS